MSYTVATARALGRQRPRRLTWRKDSVCLCTVSTEKGE